MTSLPRTSNIVTETSARNQETQIQQQHQSAQRLTTDDEELDENFSAVSNGRTTSRVIVIGWDTFRSRLMLFLIACLIIWACIFFPLFDN